MSAQDNLSPQFRVLYHGTSPGNVQGIRAGGLVSPGHVNSAGWFMLTDSREQAAAYGRGAVLEYHIPEELTHYRAPGALLWPGHPHSVYGHEATAYGLKQTLPSKYLHAVHEEPR